jgi:hypothetical protein
MPVPNGRIFPLTAASGIASSTTARDIEIANWIPHIEKRHVLEIAAAILGEEVAQDRTLRHVPARF